MTTLGEDAEEFFRSGDEGTYEGGPATVIPVTFDEDRVEHPPLAAVERQLERRRRFTRVVATIVGGLGAGIFVLGGWLLARSAPAATASPQHVEPSRQVMAAASPASAPVVAHAVTPPIAPTVLAPEPVFDPPRAVTPPPTEPHAARTEKAAPSAPAVVKRAAPTTRKAVIPRVARPVEVRASANADTLPKRSASFAGAVVGASRAGSQNPPTANFPD